MRKLILAISLLTLAACTKKSGTTTTTTSTGDSVFNGSYINVTVNGKTYNEKDVTVKGIHQVSLTATLSTSTNLSGLKYSKLEIDIADLNSIYGLFPSQNAFQASSAQGTTTGNYIMQVSSDLPVGYSYITIASPLTTYTDTTGTISVSYNGSDYIQGTISSTAFANGFTYPVTGSFKIYH